MTHGYYYGMNAYMRINAKRENKALLFLLELIGAFILGSMAGAFLYLAYINVL